MYHAPIGEHARILAHARFRPQDEPPQGMQLYTFTDTFEPGKEEFDFKMSARENDPFYAMGCHVGAVKHYIGDNIMLCVEKHHINIVIY